jgi:hypothetical protein
MTKACQAASTGLPAPALLPRHAEMAVIGRGFWELGRPRPYTGHSSTVTSTTW